MKISDTIKDRIDAAGIRYWAGDNISSVLEEGDTDLLIDEAAAKFEAVLDSLVIDRANDPNSMDTGRRLAKMYINEIMSGRYHPAPKATAFPNVLKGHFLDDSMTTKTEFFDNIKLQQQFAP